MSNYMDFWFIDNRKQIRNIIIYILIFVFLFFFVDIFVFVYNKALYKDIQGETIVTDSVGVTVDEAQATYVNGFVNGTIISGDKDLKDKSLKFDFYTKNDTNMGTKYIKLEEIGENEKKDYSVTFNFENVDHYKVSVVDNDDIKDAKEEEFFMDIKPDGTTLIGTIILLYFFL